MNCFSQIGRLCLIILVSLQLVSCGTILYPERRNQEAGRIDVGVALLDGFWLLAGLVPGLIALGVDFSTGAIYLPPGEAKNSTEDRYRIVRFDPETTTEAELESLISQETGQTFRFRGGRYEMTRVEDEPTLKAHMTRLN